MSEQVFGAFEGQPVGVGVVGFGYWGPILVRNFRNAESTRAVGICERDPERRAVAERGQSDLFITGDIDELLQLEGLDAVAIATPVATHFPLAKAALEAGKHVFVEKPFTRTADEAATLIRMARERDLRLMVDHTFLFTPAVRELHRIVAAGELGDLLYYDSVRINLGLFQPDVDVIWDLAPHDLSILDYLVDHPPVAVAAVGASHVPRGYADVAYITLDYGDNLLAHLHVNWLAPKKVRQILVGGSKKMALYDDVEPDTKIKVFNCGIEIAPPVDTQTVSVDDKEGRYHTNVNYRTGDMYAPWLARTEALLTEATLFGHHVRSGAPIPNDGVAGLRIVSMLEAASRSLEARGAFVDLDWSVLETL